MPIKADIKGTPKKLNILAQIGADSNNYLTPVDIEAMQGQKSILQLKRKSSQHQWEKPFRPQFGEC